MTPNGVVFFFFFSAIQLCERHFILDNIGFCHWHIYDHMLSAVTTPQVFASLPGQKAVNCHLTKLQGSNLGQRRRNKF